MIHFNYEKIYYYIFNYLSNFFISIFSRMLLIHCKDKLIAQGGDIFWAQMFHAFTHNRDRSLGQCTTEAIKINRGNLAFACVKIKGVFISTHGIISFNCKGGSLRFLKMIRIFIVQSYRSVLQRMKVLHI